MFNNITRATVIMDTDYYLSWRLQCERYKGLKWVPCPRYEGHFVQCVNHVLNTDLSDSISSATLMKIYVVRDMT